jgi:hypothetical protein
LERRKRVWREVVWRRKSRQNSKDYEDDDDKDEGASAR